MARLATHGEEGGLPAWWGRLQSARDFRRTCKIRNIASRPHRPILQVQQNTVPSFRESAVSATNGEFCKSLFSPARVVRGRGPVETGPHTEVCPTTRAAAFA